MGDPRPRFEGKDGHMDVIPVQGWIWKAVMPVQFHGTFVSSFLSLSLPLSPLTSPLVVDRVRGGGHIRKTKEKGCETDKI